MEQTRKRAGRPKLIEKRISLGIPIDIYQDVIAASMYYEGNVHGYITDLIRKDVAANQYKYGEIKKLMNV